MDVVDGPEEIEDSLTGADRREQARALLEGGSTAEALHAFKRATEVNPDDAEAWLGLAGALASFHCYENALTAYERVLRIDPKHPDAWLGKRKMLNRLGRSDEADEAAEQFKRALAGRRPARRPVRSPVAVVTGRFGPMARELWSSRRPLLIPALAYIGGLAVWSLNAARNDLGPQVGANLQYLVAGVIPAVVILAAAALLLVLLAAPAWTRRRLASRWPRLQRVLAFSISVIAGSWFLLILTSSQTHLDDVVPPEALLLGLAASFVVAVFVSDEGWFFDFLWKLWGVLGVVFFLAFAFKLYAGAVYPRLPQALGGGAPRCARLDLQTSAVSSATVASLAPALTTPAPETVRTMKVDILFARDDVLFVRPRRTHGEAATHELRGDAVRAVIGCRQSD